MAIRAIPTRWKGYTFRSRTEARWAVFFDYNDISWVYEPEGFVLQDGRCYLPDFYLPSVRFWAEVKPEFVTNKEENKCQLLSSGTGLPCLYLCGSPDFQSYHGVTWDCGNFTVCEYSLDLDFWDSNLRKENRLWGQPDYPPHPGEDHFSDRYRRAIYASREERFFQ